jgi:hypothetical protein
MQYFINTSIASTVTYLLHTVHTLFFNSELIQGDAWFNCCITCVFFIPTKEFKENSLLIFDHHQDISAKYSLEDLLTVAVLDQMIFLQKQSCVSDGNSIKLSD